MTSYLQFALYYNPIRHKKQEGSDNNSAGLALNKCFFIRWKNKFEKEEDICCKNTSKHAAGGCFRKKIGDAVHVTAAEETAQHAQVQRID